MYENGIIWVEVVQIMFYGSKVHCIDDKGRLTLSSIYRDEFTSQKCYACYGLDHCLELYPEETYIKKVSTITSLNDFDENARKVKRTFLSNTFLLTIDSHNRILLPKTLLEKTELAKNVIVIGMYDHLEMWDEEKYTEIEKNNLDDFAKNAKEVISCE